MAAIILIAVVILLVKCYCIVTAYTVCFQ